MIVKIICDYCGLDKKYNEITDNLVIYRVAAAPQLAKCPICKSRRYLKKYPLFDGYTGCPPFEKGLEKESDTIGDNDEYLTDLMYD